MSVNKVGAIMLTMIFLKIFDDTLYFFFLWPIMYSVYSILFQYVQYIVIVVKKQNKNRPIFIINKISPSRRQEENCGDKILNLFLLGQKQFQMLHSC